MSDTRISAAEIKSIIVPIIVNAVVGLGSAYIAIITLSTQQVYNDRQFNDIKESFKIVSQNQLVLASRGSWMEATTYRIDTIESSLKELSLIHKEDIKDLRAKQK